MQIGEVVELVKRDKLPRDTIWLHARILKLARMLFHLRFVLNDEFKDWDTWRQSAGTLQTNKDVSLSTTELDMSNSTRDSCQRIDPKFQEVEVLLSPLRIGGLMQRRINKTYPRAQLLQQHIQRYATWKEDLERTLRSMARMAK